jgi:hypothetical protein
MPPSAPPSARVESAAACVLALCELWCIIAAHSGVAGAWRLAGVCRAARQGAKEWLRKLPRLLLCGGRTGGAFTSEVWRLDLGELRWERLPDLTTERAHHACCAVRGGVVVLGGLVEGHDARKVTASVEILRYSTKGTTVCKTLPLLSRGLIRHSTVLATDENDSDQGQVLLLGGWNADGTSSAAVHKVDLATGACTPQPSLLSPHHLDGCSAARLADGRIVCVSSA